MARADGRIEKGQRLSSAISAKAWNRAQQAADVVLGVQPGAVGDGASYASAPFHWVYVVNKTDKTFDKFSAVMVGELEITAGCEVNPAGFVSEKNPTAVCKGYDVTYITSSLVVNWDAITYGIALEPILPAKCGRVAVSGVCWALITIDNPLHNFAKPRAYPFPNRLQSDFNGPFRIISKCASAPPGSDSQQLALVQFGCCDSQVIIVSDDVPWPPYTSRTFRRGQAFDTPYTASDSSWVPTPSLVTTASGADFPYIAEGLSQSQQSPNYYAPNWDQPPDGRNVTIKIWNLIGYIPQRKRIFCCRVSNNWIAFAWEGQGVILRGTFTAPWTQGSGTKAIVAQDGQTYNVENRLFNFTGTGSRSCFFAWVDGGNLGRYELISGQFAYELNVQKNSSGLVTGVSIST